MERSYVSWPQVLRDEKTRPQTPARLKQTHHHHFWVHLGWNCWEQIKDVNNGSQAPGKWVDFKFHLVCANGKILQVWRELLILRGALHQSLVKQKPTQEKNKKLAHQSSNTADTSMTKNLSHLSFLFDSSILISISHKVMYLSLKLCLLFRMEYYMKGNNRAYVNLMTSWKEKGREVDMTARELD